MNLDSITVTSPCSVPWSSMRGDERARFCERCSLTVYNLGALTRAEATELVRRREGRLCVNFVRRLDGTVTTRDCGRGVGFYVRRELAARPPVAFGWGTLTFAGGLAVLVLSALVTLFGDNLRALLGQSTGGALAGDTTVERRPASETHDPRTRIPGFPGPLNNSSH